ncbi:MAG: isoprenylcysteine carboxylmethyltransferase family protein [Pseudomonadota bacterium]
MPTLLNIMKLLAALAASIALLIAVPAWVFGVIEEPVVVFVMISYFVFFLGAVWRVVWHGKLAERKADRQVRTTSGRWSSLLSIAGMLGFHWISLYTYALGDRISLGEPVISYIVFVLSLILLHAALIVNQMAIITLGRFFDRLTIKDDHRLVTEGIYGCVRHPIYTSYILLFLGYCLMLQSFWGLLLLTATCLVWFGKRIAIEEDMLEEEFGDEYRRYCQRSKRLIPMVF